MTKNRNNTLAPSAYAEYFKKGISYDQYLKNFQAEMETGSTSQFAKYLPQNWQRQSRLDRKLQLQEALLNEIQSITRPMKWLVITEHWCGDASQINPIIQKVALQSDGKIDCRFTYRDENETLMNAHLTDGRSRSIPILIAMDKDHNFIGSYGPRPAVAQELVKAQLAKKESYDIPLHTWYAKDKQKSVQRDLVQMLERLR